MNTIDSTAHKYFYVGCLTLLIAFKFNHFEKSEIISRVDAAIEGVFKHIQLLKDISIILYFQFTLVRSLNYFLKQQSVQVSILKELRNHSIT